MTARRGNSSREAHVKIQIRAPSLEIVHKPETNEIIFKNLERWQIDIIMSQSRAVDEAASQLAQAARLSSKAAREVLGAALKANPYPHDVERIARKALAAKPQLNHGPPPTVSWRGRERATKFRSQS